MVSEYNDGAELLSNLGVFSGEAEFDGSISFIEEYLMSGIDQTNMICLYILTVT